MGLGRRQIGKGIVIEILEDAIMQKKSNVKLDELSLEDDDFLEKEMEALESLPRDENGLEELLNYLQWMDSYQGWRCLFEDYGEIMNRELYLGMRDKVQGIFDDFAF